jgi:hypothetical protein
MSFCSRSSGISFLRQGHAASRRDGDSTTIDYPGAAMQLGSAEALRSDRLMMGVWQDMGRPPCFVAGGYLRDRLLGRPSTDLDFTARHRRVGRSTARRLAAARGTRPHLLGKAPRACAHRHQVSRSSCGRSAR